ncbi:MAG: hypothetical protein AABY22_10195 [Nanoarchaeota archaeon]
MNTKYIKMKLFLSKHGKTDKTVESCRKRWLGQQLIIKKLPFKKKYVNGPS